MDNKDNRIPQSKAAKLNAITYSFPAAKPIYWGPNQLTVFGAAYNEPDKNAWHTNELLQIPKVTRFFFGDGGPPDQTPPPDIPPGSCWGMFYAASGIMADPDGHDGFRFINGVFTQTAYLWISVWKNRTGTLKLCGPEKDYLKQTPTGVSVGIYVYDFKGKDGTPCSYNALTACETGELYISLTADEVDQANALIAAQQDAWEAIVGPGGAPFPPLMPPGPVDFHPH